MRSFDTVVHIGTKWLRAVWQGPILLGVVMIGLVWTSLSFHLEVERYNSERAAIQNSSNLARVFEGHLFRSLTDIDRSLKIMRTNYVRHLEGFEFGAWLYSSGLFDDQTLQVSIIGPDGFLKLSNIASDSPMRIDLRDREHFRVHVNAKSDELFISKPLIGRRSGKWSIQLTRRIEHADGSFGGVIVASIDPTYFARFYSSIDVGTNGYIRIVGTDGIIRAVGGPTLEPLGRDLSGTILFKRYPMDSAGWFYISNDLSDSIPRLLTYRAVKGYPLIITTGVSLNEIFSGVYVKQRAYNFVAMALTALILVVTGFSVQGRLALGRISEELHTQNLRFDMALRNMSQGVCMFDGEKRLVICNDRYAKMYRLPPELLKAGTPHNTIIAHRILNGLLKGRSDDDAVRQKISALSDLPADTKSNRIDELADGRLICVTREPMEGGGWVATHEDITERKHAEMELDRTRRFLDLVIERVPLPIVVKEPVTSKFILVNQAYEAFIGLPRDKLIGGTAFDLFSKENADLIVKHDTEALQSNKQLITTDLVLETANNGSRICTTTRLVVRDSNDKPQYLIVVIEDVTERKKTESQIVYMAHHDPLTGLPNRARFSEQLKDALASVRRGAQLAVLFLDLDHFKNVNDTLGHLVGDELLKVIADRLRSCVRETDTISRLGGDEFAIVQTAIEQPADVAALANRIQAAIRAPCDVDGLHAVMDVSIGISLAPKDATEADELMKQADMALYKAKADGRGTYRFFEPEMDARMKARRKLETDLRNAIVNGEFELFHQPVVNLQDNEVVGLEALLRWHHPERGMISPAEFIPIAEETGLIVPLGEWVIRQACSDAANWPNNITVAVNLSPAQFRSQNLAQIVISALAASGVAPCRLELEITEEVLLSHNRDNLAVLNQLRKLGVRIVMDDFGTGYSSLNYLRRFPFDKIKIDRSFIADLLDGNDVSLAILEAVVSLARALKVITTAEGIETKEQLELIRAVGCTEFQGYLFSPPKPAAEIAQLFLPRAKEAVNAA